MLSLAHTLVNSNLYLFAFAFIVGNCYFLKCLNISRSSYHLEKCTGDIKEFGPCSTCLFYLGRMRSFKFVQKLASCGKPFFRHTASLFFLFILRPASKLLDKHVKLRVRRVKMSYNIIV